MAAPMKIAGFAKCQLKVRLISRLCSNVNLQHFINNKIVNKYSFWTGLGQSEPLVLKESVVIVKNEMKSLTTVQVQHSQRRDVQSHIATTTDNMNVITNGPGFHSKYNSRYNKDFYFKSLRDRSEIVTGGGATV